MTEGKQWWGRGRGEPEANKLVYTKRRKHIYAIRKHETTKSQVNRTAYILSFDFKEQLKMMIQNVSEISWTFCIDLDLTTMTKNRLVYTEGNAST